MFRYLLRHPYATIVALAIHAAFAALAVIDYSSTDLFNVERFAKVFDESPAASQELSAEPESDENEKALIQATAVDATAVEEHIRNIQQRKLAEQVARKRELSSIERASKKLKQEKIALAKKRKQEEKRLKKIRKQAKEAEIKAQEAKKVEASARSEAKRIGASITKAQDRIKQAQSKLASVQQDLSLTEQRRKKLEDEQKKFLEQARAEEKRLQELRLQKEVQRERAVIEQKKAEKIARLVASEKKRLEGLRESQLEKLRQTYFATIQQLVKKNWRRSVGVRKEWRCDVIVRQNNVGEILDVRTEGCTGDQRFVASVERAVYRSEPFPEPPDQRVFDDTIRFRFHPPSVQ